MAINTSLLVSAAVLQDYLVDKDTGEPLAAGIVTLYEDDQRSILKPWYEQQGAFPNYFFVPLPNPMTLSAVGTIQDADGNDVIPFFYPYVENEESPQKQAYYITVYNANGELQFTRSNFPFVPTTPVVSTVDTNENLLINSVFWRNIADNVNVVTGGTGSILTNTITINGINFNYAAIAPSQHDGFTMPDICYFRNSTDGMETITFANFSTNYADNVLVGDPTPQYYLEINCTAVGSETVKYIQIPLDSSIYDLSGYVTTDFTLQALAVNPINPPVITMGIFQFLGTGVLSPVVTPKSQTLSQAWFKYEVNLPIPSVQTPTPVTPSAAGDHGLYLQIGIPVGAFTIRIAMPSFYLSNTSATNSFQTNDQVNAIISSPRTGDIRTSINKFSPYGWVLANDGVISLNSSATLPSNISSARQNKDTWQLYNFLWNNTLSVTTTNPMVGNQGLLCAIYDSAGLITTKGASAYVDFIANKQLQIPLALGRVMLGLPPASNVTYNHLTNPTWNPGNLGVFTITNPVLFNLIYVGSPVYLTGTVPSTYTANLVYFAIPALDGTAGQFQLATTYANALAGTPVAAATNDGSNIVLNFALGTSFGQDEHVQLERELATHSHPGSTAVSTSANGGGPTVIARSINASAIINLPNVLNIASDGLAYPFNVVQPSTYMNVFFKL